ncbi:MAG: helix-turn-helix transcriptional regulator [Ruminococcaceae bacterium]|nr:helix-turn-helix transcriptional regulator [Oscillospiraceae bacterium]
MKETFIGDRIAELLVKKQRTAVELSEHIGQPKDYIDQITSHKLMPSMNMFFAICDALDVTPAEFFTV